MNKIWFKPDSYTAFYAKNLQKIKNRPLLIICHTTTKAQKIYDNLRALGYKNQNLYLLRPPIYFEKKLTAESVSNIVRFYRHLLSPKSVDLFIADIQSLELAPPYEFLETQNNLTISINTLLNYEELKDFLKKAGYKRVGITEIPGTFSLRGDIIDIFPIGAMNPIRIFLDDNRIDRITHIDLKNFSSVRDLETFSITFAPSNLELSPTDFGYIQKFSGFVLLDNVEILSASALFNNIKKSVNPDQLILRYKSPVADGQAIEAYEVPFFNNSLKNFISFLAQHPNIKNVTIFSPNDSYKQRLLSIINSAFYLSAPTITVKIGPFHGGFLLPNEGSLVASEDLLYHRIHIQRPSVRPSAQFFDTSSIKPGDIIVHKNFGIGRFLGIEKVNLDGKAQELVKLEYADKAFLYIPIYKLDLLSRYSGVGITPPKLSSLSTNMWQNVKKRVKQSIEKYAQQLLLTELQRRQAPGLVFEKDDLLQKEFEERFEYEETPDQIRAIQEIKRDMESGILFERLICGDSGVGKTEIALRAIAKAVFSGYQAVFIAPTVVLAKQHFDNIAYRFDGFPVKIALISRLTGNSLARLIPKIEKGEIDILVGTHKLFSKKIKFKRLGLVVIDEEHKFGVLQKQTFKERFKNINILYLSATPIPRTLYQALNGIQKMSLIQDVPNGRKPVNVIISDYDENLVYNAIKQELDRAGQVFYVHNRIQSLQPILKKLKALFPNHHIDFIHGRLDKRQIVEKMYLFTTKQIDILVSTNIVELGIDYPNANTILVEGIEKMGIAQLYQLRGRVGRGEQQGFAYLMFSPNKKIPSSVRKKFINFSELLSEGGSFLLALKDLETRGAGNLLGPEQKGNINYVGLELYTELLESTSREIRGLPSIPEKEVDIDLNLEVYIPDEYVSDIKEKILLYLKITKAHDLQTLSEIQKQLTTIYGKLSPPFNNLFFITRLKIIAQKIGIQRIYYRKNIATLELANISSLKFIDTSKAKISQQHNKLIVTIPNLASPYEIENIFKL